MPKVVKRKGLFGKLGPNEKYVGRPSKWKNPFPLPKDATLEQRLEVIALFRSYIVRQPHLMAALPELRGKDLVCHCAPLPCHADVLLELADADLKPR